MSTIDDLKVVGLISISWHGLRSAFLGFGVLVALFVGVVLAPAIASENPVVGDTIRIRINIADKALRGRLIVEDRRIRKKGIVHQVSIKLVNKGPSPLSLKYRAEWKDSDGFPVSTGGVWELVTIEGNAARAISFTGRDRDAISVEVTIDKAK